MAAEFRGGKFEKFIFNVLSNFLSSLYETTEIYHGVSLDCFIQTELFGE